ncbi:MAG: hypothetical protein MJZ18_11045 [Bacteroidales bacterium]|nr:hypothetical protein [Bacteroidales bacterium]
MKNVRIKSIFIIIALIVLPSISSCEKDISAITINRGKYVVLEKPYTHPVDSTITVSAVIIVEGEPMDNFPDVPLTAYYLSGNIPTGFSVGDTTIVRATIKEIYPLGGTNTMAGNIDVYQIIKIERIY